MLVAIDSSRGIRPQCVIAALSQVVEYPYFIDELCSELSIEPLYFRGYFNLITPPHPSVSATEAQKILDRYIPKYEIIFRCALQRLFEAEMAFHGTPEAHLHEARNVLVYYPVLYHMLNTLSAKLARTPGIATGIGVIEFSHGRFELPAPATRYLIERYDLDVIHRGDGEILTPAGAALATCIPAIRDVKGKILQGEDDVGECRIVLMKNGGAVRI